MTAVLGHLLPGRHSAPYNLPWYWPSQLVLTPQIRQEPDSKKGQLGVRKVVGWSVVGACWMIQHVRKMCIVSVSRYGNSAASISALQVLL